MNVQCLITCTHTLEHDIINIKHSAICSATFFKYTKRNIYNCEVCLTFLTPKFITVIQVAILERQRDPSIHDGYICHYINIH